MPPKGEAGGVIAEELASKKGEEEKRPIGDDGREEVLVGEQDGINAEGEGAISTAGDVTSRLGSGRGGRLSRGRSSLRCWKFLRLEE